MGSLRKLRSIRIPSIEQPILTRPSGIVSYIILNSAAWLLKYASSNRIVPYDYDHSDYWTPRPVGGILPPWLKRLFRGKRDFWREYDFDEEDERRNNGSSDGRDSVPTTLGMGTDEGCADMMDRMSPSFGQAWEMPELARVGKAKERVRTRAVTVGSGEGVGRETKSPVNPWKK